MVAMTSSGTPLEPVGAHDRPSVRTGVSGLGLKAVLIDGIHIFASEFLINLIVLLFLLNSYDNFLSRRVQVMPRFHDKRRVIGVSQKFEVDILAYLITFTVINALVDFATGCAMRTSRLVNAVLWGAVALFLNYVPLLGTLTGLLNFTGIGMLSLELLWKSFMLMAAYADIYLIEGETVMPMLLACRSPCILCSSSSHCCSGAGCGTCLAPLFLSPCWASPKSSLTESTHWPPSAISLKERRGGSGSGLGASFGSTNRLPRQWAATESEDTTSSLKEPRRCC